MSGIGGFFTSLKKEVMTIGTTKTTDQAFDTAKQNYEGFVFAVQTLKTHVDGWHAATKAAAGSAAHVANDYKNTMQNAGAQGPFAQLATDGATAEHACSQVWEGCEKQLEATCLSHFRELQGLFVQIKDRMKQREAARLDFDYRQKNVKDLHEARDKLVAKGKTETPKDADKRSQAEKKLEDATHHWNTLNNGVTAELIHLHEHRSDLLGHLYLEFLNAQKEYGKRMAEALNSLQMPAAPANAPWQISPPNPACSFTPGDSKAPAPGEQITQQPTGGPTGVSEVNLYGSAGKGPSQQQLAQSQPSQLQSIQQQPPLYAAPAPGAGPVKPPSHKPPVGGVPTASVQAQEIERRNQAASNAMAQQSAIHSSMPAPNKPSELRGDGVNLNANFAADDEAAMRRGGGQS